MSNENDNNKPSTRSCLKVLGVDGRDEAIETFGDCDGDLDLEFSALKKLYFRLILSQHPDKGGDPAIFRKTRAAFEVLRERRIDNRLQFSFLDEEELDKDEDEYGGRGRGGRGDGNDSFDDDAFFRREAERAAETGAEESVPSYEYYYEAAQEVVPKYRVELAKSGRSRCEKCKRDGGRRKSKTAKTKENETAIVAPTASSATATATGLRRSSRASTRAMTKSVATKAAAAVAKYHDPTLIPKDAIRVGSINEHAGSYGRWHRLSCWKVPYQIHAGLTNPSDKEQVWIDLLSMDEILLTNVSSLSPPKPPKNAIQNGGNADGDDDGEDRKSNKDLFIEHVMDRNNWAKKTKSSKPPPDLEQLRKQQNEKNNLSTTTTTTTVKSKKRAKPPDDDDNIVDPDRKPAATTANLSVSKKKAKKKQKKSTVDASAAKISKEIVLASSSSASATTTTLAKKKKPSKKAFKIPRPNVNGAADSTLYKGKRFVLTGTFPEIGGGIGLDLGKQKVRDLIESFGGRVTSAVSGKTDYLVVGKDPGRSKVSKAVEKDIPRIDLKSIGENIYDTIPSLTAAPTPIITNFSAGYQNNALLRY